MFSPTHSDWDSEESAQQQHHDFTSQLGSPSWQRNTHSNNPNNGGFGPYSPPIAGSGEGPGHNIQPNNPYNSGYGSPRSPEPYSRYGTLDSYDSTNTSYSRPSITDSSYIDPKLTQPGITSEFQYQTYSTDILPFASPDQLTSPAPLLHQNDSSTQATGYGTNQPGDYFGSYPMSSPLPPGQPTHHDGNPAAAGCLNPGLYGCHDCLKGFTRQTDLDRHLRTAKKHSVPSGPACPESDCKFTAKFSRSDNFKAHFKRHGKSDAEADEFIRRWRAQANPEFLVGEWYSKG